MGTDIISTLVAITLMGALFIFVSLALLQFLVMGNNPVKRFLARFVGAEEAELIIKDDLSDNDRIFRAYQEHMKLDDPQGR